MIERSENNEESLQIYTYCLIKKQKRGKARMKRFGKIDIPSEAFTVMLKRD